MKSTCPYCGVGCGVAIAVDSQGGCKVTGDAAHPASYGRLCVKGAALGETLTHQGRLLSPEVDGEKVSWTQALDAVAQRLDAVIREHGPQAVAFYASGQLLTEDYYVANKLMKGFLGVANIDTNSRLCMASAVVGYKRAFGADAVPCCYEDFTQTDLVVLAGSNSAWTHPVAYQRLVQAKQANPGMRCVVIDPRRTATCDIADLHLPLRPGSDAALFTGLLHWLATHQALDAAMLPHLNGVEQALQAAAEWPLARVAEFCRLPPEDVTRFYTLFQQSPAALTLYCMGINQSASGSDKCSAIINAHLVSGKIGRPGSGPFSLTGQPNAMGGREVGGLANQLAAQMDFSPENIARLQRFWQSQKVADRPGLKAVELFQAVGRGEIKAIWIMGTNPAVSLPDGLAVADALRRCPLTIVSDVTAHTDTARQAHILLPAQGWGEKNGTVTNSERRISRQRGFVAPAGEARPDWWILTQVARRLGFQHAFTWTHPAAIFREHAALSGFENAGSRAFDISGLATMSDRAWEQLDPVQWPVNARFPDGCARLFGDRQFYHPDGRARLIPITPSLPASQPSRPYPLTLNTGRIRDQWHTMTRTGSVPRLMQHYSEPFGELHPLDAGRYGIADGDLMRVQSVSGWMICRAQLSEAQQPGSLFVPMHWNGEFASHGKVDALVAAAVCPLSGQPESKQTAVRISRWQSDWQGTLYVRKSALTGERKPLWWVRIPEGDVTRYLLADRGEPAAWLAQQGLTEGVTLQTATAGGHFLHLLGWRNGQLELAFFSGAPSLAVREAVLAAFVEPPATAQQRFALLSGRASAGCAAGRTVCSCFGTGENQITAAIAAGCDTTEALGARLKCGTNCGSCLPELTRLIALARTAA